MSRVVASHSLNAICVFWWWPRPRARPRYTKRRPRPTHADTHAPRHGHRPGDARQPAPPRDAGGAHRHRCARRRRRGHHHAAHGGHEERAAGVCVCVVVCVRMRGNVELWPHRQTRRATTHTPYQPTGRPPHTLGPQGAVPRLRGACVCVCVCVDWIWFVRLEQKGGDAALWVPHVTHAPPRHHPLPRSTPPPLPPSPPSSLAPTAPTKPP